MILTDDKERIRFLKFVTVGAIGSVLDIVIMNLLTRFLGMRLVYAGSISFFCAVMNNFTLNRYWTYPDSRSRPLLHQLGMFVLVNAIGIGIRIPMPIAFTKKNMPSWCRSGRERESGYVQ